MAASITSFEGLTRKNAVSLTKLFAKLDLVVMVARHDQESISDSLAQFSPQENQQKFNILQSQISNCAFWNRNCDWMIATKDYGHKGC